MVKSFKSRYLCKNNDPYFISEVEIDHNGLLSLVFQIIKESKKSWIYFL